MSHWVGHLCGDPADAARRFEVIEQLAGDTGQALVYLARPAGGPEDRLVTLRVWRRPADEREVQQRLVSWENGDTILGRLSGHVPHICRRLDGFTGYPPWPAGGAPAGERVPIQVLRYLAGVSLRQRLRSGDGDPIEGPAVLHTLAEILGTFAQPEVPGLGDGPLVHQDVKASNVIIGPGGEVTLIDFTNARVASRVTSVVHTVGQSGLEVHDGSKPGLPYDVHGFGSVAYYLITRADPRTVHPPHDLNVVPGLRDHSALRDHLLRPLSTRPVDRPTAAELPQWSARLAAIVRESGYPTPGVRWTAPGAARQPAWPAPAPIPRPTPEAHRESVEQTTRAEPAEPATRAESIEVAATAGSAGPADAFVRVDDLCRRIAARPPVPVPRSPGVAVVALLAVPRGSGVVDRTLPDPSPLPGPSPDRPADQDGYTNGRAPVPRPEPPPPWTDVTTPYPPPPAERASRWLARARRYPHGAEVTLIPLGVAIVFWGVWLTAIAADNTINGVASFAGLLVCAALATAAARVAIHRARRVLPAWPAPAWLPHLPSGVLLSFAALWYAYLIYLG